MAERITLELDGPLYPSDDHASVADVIVAEAARQIAQRAANERVLADEARTLGSELLREQIAPLIEAALAAMFQPTDMYGGAKGQPKTWGEYIQDEIGRQLKLPTGARYTNDRSTLERFIQEEVERQLRTDLKATLDTARKQVLAAVEAEGAKLIRDAVQKAVA